METGWSCILSVGVNLARGFMNLAADDSRWGGAGVRGLLKHLLVCRDASAAAAIVLQEEVRAPRHGKGGGIQSKAYKGVKRCFTERVFFFF